MFSIELEDALAEPHESDEPAIWGSIVLGSFQEAFLAPVVYWSPADYKLHWLQALALLIKKNLPTCLITSMYDPAQANFIQWWLLYPSEHGTVFVQNQILFLNTIKGLFDPQNPQQHIPERITISEDGVQISEWKVTLISIKAFHDKHQHWAK